MAIFFLFCVLWRNILLEVIRNLSENFLHCDRLLYQVGWPMHSKKKPPDWRKRFSRKSFIPQMLLWNVSPGNILHDGKVPDWKIYRALLVGVHEGIGLTCHSFVIIFTMLKAALHFNFINAQHLYYQCVLTITVCVYVGHWLCMNFR